MSDTGIGQQDARNSLALCSSGDACDLLVVVG
jgi:hypothetical protein